jgi:uncharacterized protein YceH (UPF0502 family)
VRPWQWQRVEELEDQVAELKQRLASLTGPED